MLNQLHQREVVPFREIPTGIFLVKKPSVKIPLADHYGVLVAGNPLMQFGIPSYEPVIIHRTPEMRVETAESTGAWQMVDEVPPDQTYSAISRATEVFGEPGWSVLNNNCEHTARYITSGEKKSTQVENFFAIALLSVVLIGLANQNDS